MQPDIKHILIENMPNEYEEYGTVLSQYSFPLVAVSYIIVRLVFGTIIGITSSALSIKFGTRYRCEKCNISFSRIDSCPKHVEPIHGDKPFSLTRILILGGGFGEIEVLRQFQKAFQNDIGIGITLLSRDNFILLHLCFPKYRRV